jgi:signal transduction histidine kinase
LGLGLSLCVSAAKGQGGELHVRDLPGKGCVFTLELPRTSPLPSPDNSLASSGQPTIPKGR